MDDQNLQTQEPQKPARHHMMIALVLFNFVFGFLGGFLAFQVLEDNSLSTTETQQVVLQESQLISDIAEEVSPSVVSINVESVSSVDIFGRQITQSGAGTGVIINSDGLILTNKHVVAEGTQSVEVVTSDGTRYEDVEVVGRDPFNDLAYIQINNVSDLSAAKLGNSDEVKVGQKVVAIGNALGEFDNTVTSGIISGIGRPIVAGDANGTSSSSLTNLFQTDAAINPGNSGGPLLNINGEVIGINTAVAGNAENIGFAIPINDAKSGIESVESEGRLVKPYLGVRYITLDKQAAEDIGISQFEGAYLGTSNGVPAVSSNSPADKAGLQDGDVIVKVNDESVNEDNTLVSIIGKYQVGATVKLTVIRNDQEITIDVTLEEAPSSL